MLSTTERSNKSESILLNYIHKDVSAVTLVFSPSSKNLDNLAKNYITN